MKLGLLRSMRGMRGLGSTNSTDVDVLNAAGADVGSLPALAPGDRGPQVAQLQATLTNVGYDTQGIDGVYGQNTANAVGAFQSAAGLPASGSMDFLTWQALASVTSYQSSSLVPLSLPEAQAALATQPGSATQPATQPQSAQPAQGITPSMKGGLSPIVVMVTIGGVAAAAAAYFYFSSKGTFGHVDDSDSDDEDEEFTPPGRRGCNLPALEGRKRRRKF